MNITRRNPQQQGREPSALARDWDPLRSLRDLVRWDPFRDIRWDPFREMGALATSFVPDVDVKETPREFVFKVDVPGMKEGDIEISVMGNRLTISGTREEERKEEAETYYAIEREGGTFVRSFTLPEGADLEHVNAEISNGVLTVTVPKAAQAQPRRIGVRSAQSEPALGQGQTGAQSQTGAQGQTGAQAQTGAQGQKGMQTESGSRTQTGSQSQSGAQGRQEQATQMPAGRSEGSTTGAQQRASAKSS